MDKVEHYKEDIVFEKEELIMKKRWKITKYGEKKKQENKQSTV